MTNLATRYNRNKEIVELGSRIVKQRNELLSTLLEIQNYAESQMGEWSCVQPPYLPADMEVLYDIIKMCESELTQPALDAGESAVSTDILQASAESTSQTLPTPQRK